MRVLERGAVLLDREPVVEGEAIPESEADAAHTRTPVSLPPGPDPGSINDLLAGKEKFAWPGT